jgi:hypothetical protein
LAIVLPPAFRVRVPVSDLGKVKRPTAVRVVAVSSDRIWSSCPGLSKTL